jgi:hypothetical protein
MRFHQLRRGRSPAGGGGQMAGRLRQAADQGKLDARFDFDIAQSEGQ